jgi:SHS family sialic acid transporter-like MFS transporter
MAEASTPPEAGQARTKFTSVMWLALIAAFLGWMFDGMEMGLYSLVIKPALSELMGTVQDKDIGLVISFTLFLFLTGMAAGGILFGRLGDKIGRVKSMSIAILVYAVFTGLSGFARSWPQLAACRFLGAMGLGGEWGLGVALVMETWPNASRPLLAGLLGAAANFGFFASSLIGWAARAYDWGWRQPLWCGAIPAFLVFILRLGVKEPERFVKAKARGETSSLGELFSPQFRRRTFIGSGLGAVAVLGMWGAWQTWLPTWAPSLVLNAQRTEVVKSVAKSAADLKAGKAQVTVADAEGLIAEARDAAAGATEAAGRARTAQADAQTAAGAVTEAEQALEKARDAADEQEALKPVSAAIVRAAEAADTTIKRTSNTARASVLMWMALGSILGAILGGLIGDWLGRRWSYALLCIASIIVALLLYFTVHEYGTRLIVLTTLSGIPITAFFGWLPLYLPELYPTRLRATGEGFCFNVGRVISAFGVFGTGALVTVFGGIPYAAATMSAIFFLGLPVIAVAPETKGGELPE